MVRLPLVLGLLISLAGCAALSGEPETITVTQTMTSVSTTTAVAAPGTILKVDKVSNELSKDLEIRFQAYKLDSQGEASYTGYTTKVVRAGPGLTNRPSDDWPKCDDKMEGLKVEVRTIGDSEKIGSGLWPGVHCTGEGQSYQFTVKADNSLRFGKR